MLPQPTVLTGTRHPLFPGISASPSQITSLPLRSRLLDLAAKQRAGEGGLEELPEADKTAIVELTADYFAAAACEITNLYARLEAEERETDRAISLYNNLAAQVDTVNTAALMAEIERDEARAERDRLKLLLMTAPAMHEALGIVLFQCENSNNRPPSERLQLIHEAAKKALDSMKGSNTP